MTSFFPEIVAGLGLFFMGMYFLTEHLKTVGGRGFRKRIAVWTRQPFMGLLWGGIFIAVTQSTSATTFILVSMIRSGMMKVRQAMPVIVGTNMLAGVIVLVFAFDIRMGVLMILGISGIVYTSDRFMQYRNLSGAIFGAGLLFLGLHMMQSGAAPMSDSPYFSSMVRHGHQAWLYAFLAGAVLAIVMQTSLAVVVMCIAFQQAGVLSLNDSMMLIYGANTGSSVLTMILASGLTGASRQVAMFQVSYNIAGAIIFVPLFYIEYYTGAPLVRHAVETITSNNATQLAIVNLIFNFVPGILLFALVSPLERLFKKLWPETAEEKASKPRYLHEQALEDPSGAFELIELEQVRLLEQLSAIFDLLRRQERRGNGRQLAAMTEAFSTLGKTIREAIGDVSIKHRLPSEGYEHLDLLLNLQHTMETALEEIIGFAESLEKLYTNEAGIKFAKIAIEGMDAILMILIEVARHRSPDDAEMLSIMTSEDGNGVSSVRSAYLSQQNDLDREGKMHLLSAANHCERLVWLFGDMGRHYMENSRF